MSERLLQQALLDACQQEFAPFENGEKHCFSHRHNKKIKMMFKEIPRKSKKKMSLKRRVLIAVISILLAVFLGVTAMAVANRFGIFGVFSDHTEIITNDRSDVPTQIEDIYCVPDPPVGYSLYEYSATPVGVSWTYLDNENNLFSLNQQLKDGYHAYANTEGYSLVFTNVGEYEGYYIDFGEDGALLDWDNDDYILCLDGNFTVNDLTEIAKTVCVNPDLEFGYWCKGE